MNDVQGWLINIMFVAGIIFTGGYVLLWVFSPNMRREIEKPKYEMLERDRELWKQDP